MLAGTASYSLEAVQRVLDYLVAERQHLRQTGASRMELEANRQAIVVMQMRLSREAGTLRGASAASDRAA